ncbi:ferrous iron transport protein B [Candidatus Neomarinimicrobiota bacterium]
MTNNILDEEPVVSSGVAETQSIALVGNPNVGKSVVFGYLTGRYANVSNYPGTTVEITKGNMLLDGVLTEVVDTPGINNLIPSSEDEVVTRDIVLNDAPDKIVQIVDAKNLRRGLLLSSQLSEMGRPYMVCLNMSDEALDRGISIDTKALSAALGVPVVETIATQKAGLEEVIGQLVNGQVNPTLMDIKYPEEIEMAVNRLIPLLPDAQIRPKALALMVLAGETSLLQKLAAPLEPATMVEIDEIINTTVKSFTRSLTVIITQARMKAASELAASVQTVQTGRFGSIAQWLARFSVHPVGGLITGIGVLVGMYYFVGVFGAGTLVDYLETKVFGAYIVPWMQTAVDFAVPWQFAKDLLVGEFGLISMALSYSIAIVLPIVGTYFIAFGILEDSGYLPRLSVMMNKIFRAMGLNGKAVLPMVLGLGCDTMATMTTRILDSRKERIIVTLLLALGVPCSAQLGVILAMLQGISLTASFIWIGVVLGTIFAVGYLSSKILPGQSSDFLLELPPLRVPLMGNIIIKTLARLEWYLREAVPLFFLGTLILFLLDKMNVMTVIEDMTAPIVQTMLGLPKAATAAFIMGFLRRDYGAAGLFMLGRAGELDTTQVVVSLVVITLFMPCIANLFMIIKEHGWRIALAMSIFIMPFALLVGSLVNWGMRWVGGF